MFLLYRADKPLNQTILRRATSIRHADGCVSSFEQGHMLLRSILSALVRMEESGRTCLQRHFQRRQGQCLTGKQLFQMTTTHGTGVSIQNDSQIHELTAVSQIGDVDSLNANDKNGPAHFLVLGELHSESLHRR